MAIKDQEFKISDTPTAAYIHVTGTSRLVRIDFDPSGRGFFVFKPPPAKNIIDDYVNGGAASAVRLFEALRMLQTRLRHEKQDRMSK